MTQHLPNQVRPWVRQLGRALGARWGQALAHLAGVVGAAKSVRPKFRPVLEVLEDRLAPAVFNVNTLADILNPPPGVVTLRSAIEAANATPGGNTINLTVPGTYNITIPPAQPATADNTSGGFDILPTGNLTIVNTSGGTVTVNGNHLGRVFDINPNFVLPVVPQGETIDLTVRCTVTLQDFTITGGVAQPGDGATGSGGAIRDQGNVSLTLNDMTITGNIATADGGGIAMENTQSVPWTLTLNNTTVTNNKAGDAGGGVETDGSGNVFVNAGSVISGNTSVNQGAGIWLDAVANPNTGGLESANLHVSGTTISGNRATSAGGVGGGIGNAGNGSVTITNSNVNGNSAGSTGGGFGDQNGLGSLTVNDSTFLNNTATASGGGIAAGGPVTSITSSEIDGNSSGGPGGGVFANGGQLVVQSSTIANNNSAGDGGGIEDETTGTGLLDGSTITNTTIFNNTALVSTGANGGGIDLARSFTGDLKLLNDTINGNFSSTGGGLYWAGRGNVGVENTIIALNSAAVAPDVSTDQPGGWIALGNSFVDLDGNLIGVAGTGSGNGTIFSAATTQTGTVGNPLDPLLGPLQNNGGPVLGAPGSTMVIQTEGLQAGSPALGNGILAGAPPVDERGMPRGTKGTIDVGAVEQIALAVIGVPNLPFTEGVATTQTVATFFNADQTAVAGSFAATIDWGDGTPGNPDVTTGTVTGAGGSFQVSGTHAYAEVGAYMITVTISNGASTAQATSNAGVSANLTVTGAPVAAGENQVFQGTVATFTDAAGNDPASAFVASINWGDNSTSAGTVSGSNGAYTVSGTHTYSEDGSYPVSVTVWEAGTPLLFGAALSGAASQATGTASILLSPNQSRFTASESWAGLSAPATFVLIDASPGMAFEFDNVPALLSGTTPTETFGISSSSQVADLLAGRFSTKILTSTFPTGEIAGAFSLTNQSVGTTTATVAETDLAVTVAPISAGEGQQFNGPVATFTDPGAGANDTFTAAINWGDGTAAQPDVTVGTVSGNNGSYTVSGTHTYPDDGSYPVTVTVSENGIPQSQVAGSNTATVAETDLVVSAVPVNASEGQAFNGPVATFIDPSAGANDVFIANINWGDNSSSQGVVTPNGAGQYTVSGMHTYSDEGSFPVSVSVLEQGLAQLFTATLDGAQQVPPSASTATGAASILLSGDQSTVTINESWAGLSGPPTAVHIHNAAAGGNGPVVFDLAAVPAATSGAVPAQTFTVTAAQVAQLLAGDFYTNIHTAIFPGGEIRGQFVSTNFASATASVAETDVLTGAGINTLSANEGSAFSGVVATFSDTGYPGNNPNDFTATIDWGDGTAANPDVTVGTVSGSNGTLSVSGSHTYADDGVYTPTVTLSDGPPGTATATASSTITVAETDATVTVAPISASEGQRFLVPVFTFTDPSAGTNDVFTYTINWGDNSPTFSGTGTGNNFAVSVAHTYADDGSYPVTVAVSENGVPQSQVTGSNTATVAETDLVVSAVPVNASEGQAFNGAVATFTDPSAGPNDVFIANINWGDNSSSPGVVTPNGAGQYTVNGVHTYSDEGSFPVSVSVLEQGAAQLFTATLNGIQQVPPSPSAATGTASIVLSADQSSVTINESWSGLFLPPTAVHIHDAPPDVNGPVVFDLSGVPPTTSGAVPTQTFAITAAQVADLLAGNFYTNIHTPVFPSGEIRGQFLSTNFAGSTASVADADVLSGTGINTLSATEGSAFSGVVATFSDTGYAGNSAGDFTATIDWGDGTPGNPDVTAGTVSGSNGTFSVSGGHIYTDEGTFTPKVTLSDGPPGNATASATSTMTVSEGDVLSGRLAAFTPIENQTFSGTVATFSDTYTVSPASDFTASINWGDGTTSTGTVTGGNGTFTVSGSHSYAHSDNFQVKVTLSENAPGTATASVKGTIAVAEGDELTGTEFDKLSVKEGAVFSGVVATFTNANTITPASAFTASIDWGDGTAANPDVTSGTVSGTGGNFSVSGSHTYTNEAWYPVTVTLTENAPGTASASVQSTIEATEADQLSGTLIPFTPIRNQQFSGPVAVFTSTYTGSPASDFAAFIDWGDGSPKADITNGVVAGGNGTFTVSGTHTYTRQGNFSVIVTLFETGDGSANATVDPVVTVGLDQLSQLQDQYGFHFTGSYDQSYHGLNAKWFQDRTGHWYALASDGTLSSWTSVNGQDKFTTIAVVDVSIYDNPELLFQNPVTFSPATQAQLTQLEQTYGFHFAGSYWQNYLGLNDKWVQASNGAWFVLTPDGQLRPWTASGLGAAIATLDPAVWDHPDYLFAAALTQSTPDQLGQLEDQYGFQFTGNYDQSYHGLNDKWFQDRTGHWYALASDGTLSSWSLVNGKDSFTTVAQVDAAVWADPQLLFLAPVTLSSAALVQIGQLEQADGFKFAGSYWQNYLGLQEKWVQDSGGAWFVLTPDGQLRPWQASGLGSVIATVDPAVWDHPDLLFGS